MPRPKKQHLTKRKDGRFCCKYKGIQFMGRDEDEALQAREDYIRREKAQEFARENPTVSDYAERWISNTRAGSRAWTQKITAIHLDHLTSVIGDIRLASVRPSDIKSVYTLKYADVSDGYIRHARSLFKAIFSAAVEDGIIRTNPVTATSAQPHRGSEGHHRAITPEERNLIDTVALDHPASLAARVLLYTGLRPQELKALRIEDIDFDQELIHVHSFVHKAASNRYEVDQEGKTARSTRDVPLLPPVRDLLKGRKGLVVSHEGKLITPSVWRNDWRTWTNAIERHLNGMQRRWYGKTQEHKALIAEGKPLPPWRSFDVDPYDLRHSFATWCRDNGVEVHVCIDWMGHADASMIMRIYDDASYRSKIEAEKLKTAVFGMQSGMQK